MLKDKDSSAIVAVSDIDRAKDYYGRVLGLEATESMGDEVVAYRTGRTGLTVYRSDYAGTNKANAVTWEVGDELSAIVDDLKAKDVLFEHYDMPGAAFDGAVHHADGMDLVWFKDPDGNILHLIGKA